MSVWKKLFSLFQWENTPSLKTPLGATLLQKINIGLDGVDTRCIELDTKKMDISDAMGMISDWQMDLSTGVITVTRKDGTVQTYDTALEKIPMSGIIDTDTNKLIFTNTDGSKTEVDISKLITQYEFVDSETIGFYIDATGKVSSQIKDGSITEDKLEIGYLTNIKMEVVKAQAASQQATEMFGAAAEQAAVSKSYAVGGTGSRSGEDADNAKYYMEQAKAIVKIDIATNAALGIVKPDGKTITIDADGTLHGVAEPDIATNEKAGVVKPDGKTITIDKDGTLQGGLRYNDGLEYWNGTEWMAIPTGNTGIVPLNVKNITASVDDAKVMINWTDPNDISIEGQVISEWAGTRLVRKEGDYPNNATDGVVLVDNKERNKYETATFVDSGLVNGTIYYYQLFPYNNYGAVNQGAANRISATPYQKPKFMSIIIDTTLPYTSPDKVVYADDALEMAKGSDAWDEYFEEKPCLFKMGQFLGYIDKNDFKKYENGEALPFTYVTTDRNMGYSVLIEFPLKYLKVENVSTTKIKVTMSKTKFEGAQCYAHTKGNTIHDNFYIGAYLSGVQNSFAYSLSDGYGATVLSFADAVKCNSYRTNYYLLGFYQFLFVQCMFLLKYRTVDSRTTIGTGKTTSLSSIKQGELDNKGMTYGTEDSNSSIKMKLFGMESFWNPYGIWLNGIIYKQDKLVYTTKNNTFSTAGEGYEAVGSILPDASVYSKNLFNKVLGTTAGGFLPSNKTTDTAINFSDKFYFTYVSDGIDRSKYPIPLLGGGNYNGDPAAGIFSSAMWDTYTSSAGVASRLMYLGDVTY